jgi:hypothetical protein
LAHGNNYSIYEALHIWNKEGQERKKRVWCSVNTRLPNSLNEVFTAMKMMEETAMPAPMSVV